MKLAVLGLLTLFAVPGVVTASEGATLDPPAWTALPFILWLLAIALLPLAAEHFWHSNRNKALLAGSFSLPVVLYLLGPGGEASGGGLPALSLSSPGAHALGHSLGEYVSFIILLAALYTVAGGIELRGDIEARPATNVGFLALGAVLANLIGTTGASMLLIRPVLQINQERHNTRHLPVFFIFVVSNLGGLLTPLGDPPLFLGFLKGVDFFWTLSLWPQWLVVNAAVLAVFWVWDALAYRRETPQDLAEDVAHIEPIHLRGWVNLLFLTGVMAAVVLQSPAVGRRGGELVSAVVACPPLTLTRPWGELLMLAMALLSLACTPRGVRQSNGFSWGAITEVAVLFVGIFVTMTPALAWLGRHGAEFGVTEPWQYFWLAGGLSSFLDNAPTYVTFATLAAGPHDFAWLADQRTLLLQAISCGAVFMGANTYIGNGPNFMVKAIADEAGVRTPSFFGYLLYSGAVLLPVFALITLLFF